MGRLDVCNIGHSDSDAGGVRTHVNGRTVDHEIIAATSGVGDGSGGSGIYVEVVGLTLGGEGLSRR